MSMTRMTFLRKLVKMKRPHFPVSGLLKMNKGSVTSLCFPVVIIPIYMVYVTNWFFLSFREEFYLFIYLDPEWRELNTRPLGITHHHWGWGMPQKIILLLACHFSTTFVRVQSGFSISWSLLTVCWDPPGVWLPVTATEFCSYWQQWQWPRSLNFEWLCKHDGTGTCLYGYCLGLTLSTWIWF